MKKLLIALTLASSLVAGSVIAHPETATQVVPGLVKDKVSFIGFDKKDAAERFVSNHPGLTAAMIHSNGSGNGYTIAVTDLVSGLRVSQ